MDLRPLRWNLPFVTKGDTFPAVNFVETASTENLTRVRVKVKTSLTATASLTLDSDATGMTINTATAGAWDFNIDKIAEVSLDAGIYLYDLETTDAAGTVRTEFAGAWEIGPEVTD